MINKGLMSSNTDEWATPQLFYEELNKKYNFNLDPCSTDNNHKCKKYFTKKDNAIIVDLYGGSGSTLIACEKTNNICYCMEYEPSYIDVIIQRWENFTGEKAVKIN